MPTPTSKQVVTYEPKNKRTILTVFNYEESNDSFIFYEHIPTYRPLVQIITSPQPHSLDCLFLIDARGEWMLTQWHRQKFFPIASGSIVSALSIVHPRGASGRPLWNVLLSHTSCFVFCDAPPTADSGPDSMYSFINRIRHFSFTTSIHTQPFPIVSPASSHATKQPVISQPQHPPFLFRLSAQPTLPSPSSTSPHYNAPIQTASAFVLCDTPHSVSILSFFFHFDSHTFHPTEFALINLHPSTSKILSVVDIDNLFTVISNTTSHQMVKHVTTLSQLKQLLANDHESLRKRKKSPGDGGDSQDSSGSTSRKSRTMERNRMKTMISGQGNTAQTTLSSRLNISTVVVSEDEGSSIQSEEDQDKSPGHITTPTTPQPKSQLAQVEIDDEDIISQSSSSSSYTGSSSSSSRSPRSISLSSGPPHSRSSRSTSLGSSHSRSPTLYEEVHQRHEYDQGKAIFVVFPHSDIFLPQFSSTQITPHSKKDGQLPLFQMSRNMFSTTARPPLSFIPFAVFSSYSIMVCFNSLLALYLPLNPPLATPPTSILFTQNNHALVTEPLQKAPRENPQSTIDHRRRFRKRKVNSSMLFIAAGSVLLVLTRGKIFRHYYSDKTLVGLTLLTGQHWVFNESPGPNMHSTISLPINPEQTSTTTTVLTNGEDPKSSISVRSHTEPPLLVKGRTRLFIISAQGAFQYANLETGIFEDLRRNEHIGIEPIYITTMAMVPPANTPKFFLFRDYHLIGTGQKTTGAIQLMSLGFQAVPVVQGQVFDSVPQIFTSKLFEGARNTSLILIRENAVQHSRIDNTRQTQSSQTLCSISSRSFDPIHPASVGLDLSSPTLAFGEVDGGFCHVRDDSIWIVPTIDFSLSPPSPVFPSTLSQFVIPTPKVYERKTGTVTDLNSEVGLVDSEQPLKFSRAAIDRNFILVASDCVLLVYLWLPIQKSVTLLSTLSFPETIVIVSLHRIRNELLLSVAVRNFKAYFIRIDPHHIPLTADHYAWRSTEIFPKDKHTRVNLLLPRPLEMECSTTFINANKSATRLIRNVTTNSVRYVRLYDIDFWAPPNEILFTTFGDKLSSVARQRHSFGESESSSAMECAKMQFKMNSTLPFKRREDVKPTEYSEHDCVMLVVTYPHGQFICSLIPLTALLHRRPTFSSLSLSMITTHYLLIPRNPHLPEYSNVLLSYKSTHAKVHADEIYLHSGHVWVGKWDPDEGMVMCTPVAWEGNLEALIPISLGSDSKDDQTESVVSESTLASPVPSPTDNQSLLDQGVIPNSDMDDPLSSLVLAPPVEATSFPLHSPRRHSDSIAENYSSFFDTSATATLPIPTHVWFGAADHRLTFGRVETKPTLTRDSVPVPSAPISIAYVIVFGAIACLLKISRAPILTSQSMERAADRLNKDKIPSNILQMMTRKPPSSRPRKISKYQPFKSIVMNHLSPKGQGKGDTNHDSIFDADLCPFPLPTHNADGVPFTDLASAAMTRNLRTATRTHEHISITENTFDIHDLNFSPEAVFTQAQTPPAPTRHHLDDRFVLQFYDSIKMNHLLGMLDLSAIHLTELGTDMSDFEFERMTFLSVPTANHLSWLAQTQGTVFKISQDHSYRQSNSGAIAYNMTDHPDDFSRTNTIPHLAITATKGRNKRNFLTEPTDILFIRVERSAFPFTPDDIVNNTLLKGGEISATSDNDDPSHVLNLRGVLVSRLRVAGPCQLVKSVNWHLIVGNANKIHIFSSFMKTRNTHQGNEEQEDAEQYYSHNHGVTQIDSEHFSLYHYPQTFPHDIVILHSGLVNARSHITTLTLHSSFNSSYSQSNPNVHQQIITTAATYDLIVPHYFDSPSRIRLCFSFYPCGVGVMDFYPSMIPEFDNPFFLSMDNEKMMDTRASLINASLKLSSPMSVQRESPPWNTLQELSEYLNTGEVTPRPQDPQLTLQYRTRLGYRMNLLAQTLTGDLVELTSVPDDTSIAVQSRRGIAIFTLIRNERLTLTRPSPFSHTLLFTAMVPMTDSPYSIVPSRFGSWKMISEYGKSFLRSKQSWDKIIRKNRLVTLDNITKEQVEAAAQNSFQGAESGPIRKSFSAIISAMCKPKTKVKIPPIPSFWIFSHFGGHSRLISLPQDLIPLKQSLLWHYLLSIKHNSFGIKWNDPSSVLSADFQLKDVGWVKFMTQRASSPPNEQMLTPPHFPTLPQIGFGRVLSAARLFGVTPRPLNPSFRSITAINPSQLAKSSAWILSKTVEQLSFVQRQPEETTKQSKKSRQGQKEISKHRTRHPLSSDPP
ncbi:hypothetical protein BLNAU_6534 [Blattamonas nauphoetae]|uniref:Transmembrane protein n=1 Tax=Blattamonas nauphoetae TaxID=2049346 RepID=A0ABQ9Y432_9EUKA|nr:hypothetical protein BLNAU_6534 [Blattamonas nauphoetae]